MSTTPEALATKLEAASRDRWAFGLDLAGAAAELRRLAKVEAEFAEMAPDHKQLRKEVKLLEHKVITCGVAASHPNAALTLRDDYMKWDSPQAQEVRKLRAERDSLLARLGFFAQEVAYAEIHGWPRESQKRLTDMVDALLKSQRDKAAA